MFLCAGCATRVVELSVSVGSLEDRSSGYFAYYRQSLATRRRVLRENHPDIARSATLLGELLLDRGDDDAAESVLRESVDVRRASLGERHPETAWAEVLRGQSLLQGSRREEAAPMVERAVAVLDSAYGSDAGRTARAAEILSQLRAQAR